MGGKGKGKAGATTDVEDHAAARAKLRREIQEAKAKAELSDKPDKSGTSRWRRRDEAADSYSAADQWWKYDESYGWGEHDEADRWGKRDRGDRWGKRYDSDRWDTYEGRNSRQAWAGADSYYKSTTANGRSSDYKGSTGGKGSSDNKGKYDNREKGSSFGKDREEHAKGKGKGKDRYKAAVEENASPQMSVQDLESKLTNTSDVQKAKTTSVTTPLEIKGVFCEVRKHTDMGCAVVSMKSVTDRDAVLELGKRSLSEKGRPQVEIIGVTADMRPHAEGDTGIFVAWGHGKEKQTPLSATVIAEAFDNLYREIKGMPLSPINHPATEAVKDQSLQRQEQQPSATSVPQAMPPQMGQPQVAQAPSAQQQMALLAQRQMMLQQMALAAQRPQLQQNMQQMAAFVAAARAQVAGQALNMPGNIATPAMAQQQQQAYMRAEAATFTPAAGQQNQWPQQFQQAGQQSANMTPMWYTDTPQVESSALGQQSPAERRPLQIVDPQSGKAIAAPVAAPSQSALDYLDVKPPARRALTIVDPSSGKTVDTLAAVNFKPAEGKKPLSIIDPSSGSTVKI